MGWLRELLEHSNLKSFDSLAKSCVKHPCWPQDVVIQSRSLGALLGKLDRREELDWLTSRPEVQGILAELLGARFSDLQLALPQPNSSAERWRWRDAPRAASLDLLREALPPAFPRELETFGHVGTSAQGERWLWEAPPGFGQDLLSRWLVANQRVELWAPNHDLAAHTFARPLLIDMARSDSSHVQHIAQLLLQLPRTLNVLVIAPPHLNLTESNSPPWKSFTKVNGDANGPDLHRVLAWLLPRLPEDSTLSAPGAREFVRRTLTERHWAGFDDILSLCGTIDEVSFDGRSNLERLFSALVSVRLKRLAQDPLGPWLKKHAMAAISGIFEELILLHGTDFSKARSIDEWSALVPQEFQNVVDVNWLKRTLPEADTHIRARDIERAAKRLSPGSFHIVLALQRLGFLSDDGTGALVFAPYWLGQYLFDDVLATSARLAAPQLGTLLLSEHAPEITTRLARSFARARIELDSVLEHAEDAQLSSVVTLELAFRLTAFGLFCGIDCENELLSELWEAQLRSVVVDSEGAPSALLSFPKTQTAQQPLLSDGFFCLAGLALAERALPSCRVQPALDPFRRTPDETIFRRILDNIQEFLALAEPRTDTAWLSEVHLLLHRVRARIPSPLKDHPVFIVSEIAEHSINSTLTWSALARLPLQSAAVDAWRRITEASRAWSQVVGACFTAYQEAGFPANMGILATNTEFAQVFWRDVPGAFALELVRRNRGVRMDLAEGAWGELLNEWSDAFPPEFLAQLPAKKVQSLLHDFEHQPHALLAAAWSAHADTFEAFCQEQFRLGKTARGIDLMLHAPNASFTKLISTVGITPHQIITLAPKTQKAIRERLHASARDRSEGFAHCLKLLLDLAADPLAPS